MDPPITMHEKARAYAACIAGHLMALDCPGTEATHQPAICPRCQASFRLAQLLTELENE